MSIDLQPVRVETGGPDEEGNLVFVDGRLSVVLVRLSDQHGERAGNWFVEAAFGRYDGPTHATFPDLNEARAWILRRRAEFSGNRTLREP